MKDKIKFEEFLEIEKRLEILAGFVEKVEPVEKSKKLLKLTVKFSPEDVRTVVTNIKTHFAKDGLYAKNFLEGNAFLFVTNLEPVTMMGVESTAMILPGPLEEGKLLSLEMFSLNDQQLRVGGTKLL